MTLGDRVAVMRKGELQQLGSPRSSTTSPCNLFVAGFIGSPAMNFMPVEVDGGTAKLPFCEVEIGESVVRELESHSASNLMAGVRPEHFEDAKLIGDQEGPRFEVEVTILESMGRSSTSTSTSMPRSGPSSSTSWPRIPAASRPRDSGQIVARLDATSGAKRGERVELWMDPTSCTSSTSSPASGSPRPDEG